MLKQRHYKLGIGLFVTCAVYIVATFFYSSYAELKCDKAKNRCIYNEKNLMGKDLKSLSFALSDSEITIAEHKHQYYTGRIVKKKTTTDYQLEVQTSEFEIPIFDQTYIRREPLNIKSQWTQFKQDKTQNNLLIEQGIVGWIWYLFILIGILGLEILTFILSPHQKK